VNEYLRTISLPGNISFMRKKLDCFIDCFMLLTTFHTNIAIYYKYLNVRKSTEKFVCFSRKFIFGILHEAALLWIQESFDERCLYFGFEKANFNH
jgi:hypothetical protein